MNTQDIISSTIENAFLKYQTHWLKDQRRFKLGLWARQTGKDYTCAAEAVFDCLQNPKTHWLILACGERQARESLEKARDWAESILSLVAADVRRLTPSSRDANDSNHAAPADQKPFAQDKNSSLMTHHLSLKLTRQSATELRFSNGSRISALPAKPSTIRGYSANLILTEFAFHDDP